MVAQRLALLFQMKCNFELITHNLDEPMPIVAARAEKSHNMKEVPPETVEKINKATNR